jgi:hypothetical protein
LKKQIDTEFKEDEHKLKLSKEYYSIYLCQLEDLLNEIRFTKGSGGLTHEIRTYLQKEYSLLGPKKLLEAQIQKELSLLNLEIRGVENTIEHFKNKLIPLVEKRKNLQENLELHKTLTS